MNDEYNFEVTLANGHGAIMRVLLQFSRRRATITRMRLESDAGDACLSVQARCRDAAMAHDIRLQIARMVEVISVGSGTSMSTASHLAAAG